MREQHLPSTSSNFIKSMNTKHLIKELKDNLNTYDEYNVSGITSLLPDIIKALEAGERLRNELEDHIKAKNPNATHGPLSDIIKNYDEAYD